MGLDVDELDAVEVGLLADDVVHHLRRIVDLVAAHDRLADPIERDSLALQRLDEAVDAPAVFLAPFVEPEHETVARVMRMWIRSQKPIIITPMCKVSLGGFLGLHFVVELGAREAGQGAMLAGHLQAACRRRRPR